MWSGLCAAHEVRPAYLELRETAAGEFSVLWKTPMLDDARLALDPAFSGEVAQSSAKVSRRVPGAAIQTWAVRTSSLRGQSLRIEGLEGTMTDALVRIEFADGSAWTQRLTPRQPAAAIPAKESPFAVAGTYLALGVEHILAGIDHLLFVLGLMMIVRQRWRLLLTVTAFTVAHSITLALATLGVVHVPSAPVEAVIALSIVFVAAEILRAREGKPGSRARAVARRRRVRAAARLRLRGRAERGRAAARHVPLALLFFNLGVEAGQLRFVAVLALALAGGA